MVEFKCPFCGNGVLKNKMNVVKMEDRKTCGSHICGYKRSRLMASLSFLKRMKRECPNLEELKNFRL